jgi:hypothetical protein
VTLQVESPLPILATTFAPKFALFEVEGPGSDTVLVRHHFGRPPSSKGDSVARMPRGESLDTAAETGRREVYRRPPWAIYRQGRSWIYESISSDPADSTPDVVAVFDDDHTAGDVYSPRHVAEWWRDGGLGALTMMSSDQILLARLLADREACLLHSAGVVLDGHGLVFVGHSDAGKSTTVELLRRGFGARLEILCDDRTVVRRWPEGFRVHGTWSHGDVVDVSPAEAPLRAILFLEQSEENGLLPLEDRGEAWRRLLATIIKPLETADWWRKEMDVLERLIAEVPCYRMRFDRGGGIVGEIDDLVRSGGGAERPGPGVAGEDPTR